jgi:hypothetical protein
MCCCEDTINNQGEIIGGGGGEPPGVEPTLHYTTAFNPNLDYLALTNPLYEDDYIQLGWDAPGNDLEAVVKQTSALYEASIIINASNQQTTLMSQINFKYDLYPNGITASSVGNGGLASYNNPTAPFYIINLQRTGSSTQCILNIEIHNLVVDNT